MHIVKRALLLMSLIGYYDLKQLHAQTTASFNFSATAHPVSGWVNVVGDPSKGVRTATAGTITISSVATANWSGYNGSAAFDGGGVTNGVFFPASVMINEWYQYSNYYGLYNAMMPQLEITGLSVDSVYTIKLTASYNNSNFDLDPTRYTITGAAIYGYIDVNGNFNSSDGAVFHNIAPDASGKIKVYVNTTANSTIAGICGIQIVSGHTITPVPTVNITHPSNNAIIPEDGNVTISATATETSGTIVKVEFYSDTTKIGEDSTAPYSMIWYSPNPGNFTIKARAIDGLGNTNISSVSIAVESLNYFWSTTGNIATGGDTSFVGTVDSNRLAFRTRNLERMSISPSGNVGIGIISPTAQLHTTGTVRLAGLTKDSTKTRVVVGDSSGNLFYRDASSLGSSGRWAYSGGVVYDSADNVGIGTANTFGYKLAVNGTAIFTKVKVKSPQSAWPDYVFKKEYRLPALAEVQQYITMYNHLPGIVSAEEVQHAGVDVGENQAALLKKIEELTLYLIEENNKLDKQQQEIDTLKDMIRRLTTTH